MFVRIKETPNSPRKSVQIVQSIRSGSKVSQKIVRYVGIALNDEELKDLRVLAETIKVRLEQETQAGLFSPEEMSNMNRKADKEKKILLLNSDGKQFQVDLAKLKEEARVIEGIHEVYGRLYEQLGLGNLFPVRQKRSGKIFKEMVLARIAKPKSKLKTTEVLQREFGVRLSVEAVYRMMEQTNEEVIERLKKISFQEAKTLLKEKLDVLFFDATTLYIEGFEEDSLRALGYSKDGKFNQPQILLALLVTRDGLPVGYEVFPGNMYEGHTLIPCLQKLRHAYAINSIVFVADSGLFNAENLSALRKEGFTYIVGARLRNQKEEIKNLILQKENYKDMEEGTKVQEIVHPFGRLIVSSSEKRAQKDRFDREKTLKKLLLKMNKKKKINAKDFLKNYGYKKLLKIEGESHFVVDESKMITEAKFDGLHGVITNAEGLRASEAIEQYKQLWTIEEAFRLSKHDLAIRPMFHYKENRIRAHIAIVFASLYLAKHLHYRIRLQYQQLSIAKITEELLSVQSSIYYYAPKKLLYRVPGVMSLQARKIYGCMGLSKWRTPKIVDIRD